MKRKSRKNCLPDHEDAIISIFSPYGINGGLLFTASQDGGIIGTLIVF